MFALFLTITREEKYSEYLLGGVPGDSFQDAARQLHLKLLDDPAAKNDHEVAWPEWLPPLRPGYKNTQFSLYLSNVRSLTTKTDVVEAMQRNFR